jgi:hypothetical protein
MQIGVLPLKFPIPLTNNHLSILLKSILVHMESNLQDKIKVGTKIQTSHEKERNHIKDRNNVCKIQNVKIKPNMRLDFDESKVTIPDNY